MQDFLKSIATPDLLAEAEKIAAEIEREHAKFFSLIDARGATIEDVCNIPEAENINSRLKRLFAYNKQLGDELCQRTIKSLSQQSEL